MATTIIPGPGPVKANAVVAAVGGAVVVTPETALLVVEVVDEDASVVLLVVEVGVVLLVVVVVGLVVVVVVVGLVVVVVVGLVVVVVQAQVDVVVVVGLVVVVVQPQFDVVVVVGAVVVVVQGDVVVVLDVVVDASVVVVVVGLVVVVVAFAAVSFDVLVVVVDASVVVVEQDAVVAVVALAKADGEAMFWRTRLAVSIPPPTMQAARPAAAMRAERTRTRPTMAPSGPGDLPALKYSTGRGVSASSELTSPMPASRGAELHGSRLALHLTGFIGLASASPRSARLDASQTQVAGRPVRRNARCGLHASSRPAGTEPAICRPQWSSLRTLPPPPVPALATAGRW